MSRLVSDKEEIFNRLYASTRDSVYRYISNYSNDTQLIEDLMQEAYMKIWHRLDKIQNIEQALPLIRTYTRNLLIDVIRRRMREDLQWLAALEKEAEQIAAPTTSRENRQQLEILETAINRLPETCRKVYLYHREQGLSYKEIAQQLSVSVSMVEKHMSRAIRLLKKDLLSDPALLLFIVATIRPH